MAGWIHWPASFRDLPVSLFSAWVTGVSLYGFFVEDVGHHDSGSFSCTKSTL